MTTSFLLALLPPEELTSRMTAFRERHGIVDAAAFPHITVKSSLGLMPDLWWGASVARLAARVPAPTLQVRGPRLFPNQTAVYLDIHSEDARQLHMALLRVLEPPEIPETEGTNLKLHLTLALHRRTVSLPEILTSAKAEFAELDAAPLTFTCPALTLMCKVGSGNAYEPVEEWVFPAPSARSAPLPGRAGFNLS